MNVVFVYQWLADDTPISPSSDATVTVELPATTDCTAQGAIGTSDQRMLSTGLEIPVVGS